MSFAKSICMYAVVHISVVAFACIKGGLEGVGMRYLFAWWGCSTLFDQKQHGLVCN